MPNKKDVFTVSLDSHVGSLVGVPEEAHMGVGLVRRPPGFTLMARVDLSSPLRKCRCGVGSLAGEASDSLSNRGISLLLMEMQVLN